LSETGFIGFWDFHDFKNLSEIGFKDFGISMILKICQKQDLWDCRISMILKIVRNRIYGNLGFA